MRLTLFLLASVVLTAAAPAQVQQRQPEPVDQAVGDLDPLATSFRRLDPGLAQFDAATALRPLVTEGWRRTGGLALDPLTGLPLPEGYVYTAPGFRAYLPQAEYVVRSQFDHTLLDRNTAPANDGEFRHLPPANMVYDLIYRAPERSPAALNPAAVDRRLDTRIDARLPAVRSGGGVGNIDYADGVMLRSPQQTLIDFYRGDNREVVRGGSGQVQQRAPGEDRAKPHMAGQRLRAQEHVVDEADAAEARGDESDHAAGE